MILSWGQNLRKSNFLHKNDTKPPYFGRFFVIFACMIVKEIEFNKEKLLSGIDKIYNAVGSTMGPMGRTVLIESEHHVGGLTVTKDGVTVAKSIVLEDPIENLAVSMVRQASERTATVAGDGTTTSVVLTHAILDAYIKSGDPVDARLIRKIKENSEKVIENLKAMATPLDEKSMKEVALVSCNGDEEIAGIVYDAYSKVGRDGIVTVENSSTSKTYSEVVKGIRIQRGWSSKYLLTDQKKQEVVLDNPLILISDREIPSVASIEHILAHVINQNRSILIVGELGDRAMEAINLNKIKGILKVGVVLPPQFGYKRRELMGDLAAAVGAKYVTDETGDDFSLLNFNDLGEASKVIISKDSTVLLLDDDTLARKRVEEIKEMDANSPDEISMKNERIAIISGAIGVIYVGASSDIEQKEKRDRVDDAVCAVAAAIEEGVVVGGGYALLDACHMVDPTFAYAMGAPHYQILSNAGMDSFEIRLVLDNYKEGSHYDPISGDYVNFKEIGIVDPLKVTRSAVENATSVATTILSTDCIIYNIRANESGK